MASKKKVKSPLPQTMFIQFYGNANDGQEGVDFTTQDVSDLDVSMMAGRYELVESHIPQSSEDHPFNKYSTNQ